MNVTHAKRGKPYRFFGRSMYKVSLPQGKQKYLEGRGYRKKRMPSGNREDRGSRFALRLKAADFLMVSNDKPK